jgi:hypothetical protein
VLSTLRGNAPHGLTNLPPAGPVSTGGLSGLLAQTVRRTPKLIGKLECGQRSNLFVLRIGHYFSAAVLEQGDDERLQGWWHLTNVPSMAPSFNHVLTTMC